MFEMGTESVEKLVRHLIHDWIPDEGVKEIVRHMISYLQYEGIEVESLKERKHENDSVG